jgi:hypothetical protein
MSGGNGVGAFGMEHAERTATQSRQLKEKTHSLLIFTPKWIDYVEFIFSQNLFSSWDSIN